MMKKQMTDKEFDLLVRQKIEQTNSEVPANLWEGIDAALNKAPIPTPKVKTPFVSVGAAIITTAIVVIGLAVYFTTGKTNQTSERKREQIAAAQEQKQSAAGLSPTTKNTQNISKPTKEIANSTQHISASLPTHKKSVNIANQAIPVKASSDMPLNKAQAAFASSRIEPMATDNIDKSANDKSLVGGNEIKEKVSVKDSILTLTPSAQILAVKPATDTVAVQNNDEKVEAQTPASKQVKKEPSKNDTDKRFYWQTSFAPAYTYRLNTGDAGLYPQSYFDAMESGGFGWTADVSGKYKLNERLFINGGLSLESYVLSAESDASNLVGITSDEDEVEDYQLATSVGTILIHSDSPLSGTIDMAAQQLYLTFSAGVDYYFYKYYFLCAGLDYSVLLSNNYTLLLNNQSIKNTLSNVSQDNYGIHVGAGREFPLSRNLSLMVYPEIRWRFDSLVSNQPFTAMPYIVGLHVGVKF